MRPLLELLLLFVIALIGWNRPYSEQAAEIFPWLGPLAVTAAPTPVPQTPVYHRMVAVRPVATPLDRSWLFGPSPLDPPPPKNK